MSRPYEFSNIESITPPFLFKLREDCGIGSSQWSMLLERTKISGSQGTSGAGYQPSKTDWFGNYIEKLREEFGD